MEYLLVFIYAIYCIFKKPKNGNGGGCCNEEEYYDNN